MSDADTQLKISDGLIALERGHDELLLANNIEPRPLYVKEGRRYILDFLKAAAEFGTSKKIIAAYPHEANLLAVMLDYGILVPPGDNRQKKILEMSSAGVRTGKRMTISLYLLLSQSCNMSCLYCLDGKQTYQTDKNLRMSKEVAFQSIDRCLDEIDEHGRLELIFFGGEPLLNWPLAREAITHCEKRLRQLPPGRQRQYHFTSNLSFLPGELIEWAKKYDISFLCNIDGLPAIHDRCRPFQNGSGSHDSTARTIRQVSQAGLRIDLRATVTALNQDHLPEVVEHHKALGGMSSALCPVNPINSDGSFLPEYLLPSADKVICGMSDVYRSKLWKDCELYPFSIFAPRFTAESPTVVGCGAPYGHVVVVDAHGDVYPCIYLVGNKKFYMGNMMNAGCPKTGLLERLYEQLHVDHLEDCKQCSWRYLCGGSCPLGRLTISNHPQATAEVKTYCKQIRCDVTRSVLELLLWEKATETAAQCTNDPAPVSQCL
jgi:uncharacterized protein